MLVVRACYRPCATFSEGFLDGTKRRFFTLQAQWNVEGICLRAKCHGAPTLEASGAWAHVDLDTDLWNLAWKISYFPVLRVHLHYRLITQIGRVNELASGSIELPKDRKSTRLNSSHLGISYAVFC